MNPRTEALALRITQTWRNGPAQNIWADALEDLPPAQVEAAYRKLRDEAERAPSIAEFKAVCRSLTIRHHDTDGPNGCHYCDGYGWISITEHHHGYDYTASRACTNCAAGKDAKRTIDACHKNRSAA